MFSRPAALASRRRVRTRESNSRSISSTATLTATFSTARSATGIVAFVREPLSLYRSYWRLTMDQSRMSTVWDQRNPFDVACTADTFEGFVENVLRLEPGWWSRMFEDYVGPCGGEVGFVGRYESLVEDLILALRITDTAFDERAVRVTPPANVSTVNAALAQFSDDLSRRVRDQERVGIRRFGYGRSRSVSR